MGAYAGLCQAEVEGDKSSPSSCAVLYPVCCSIFTCGNTLSSTIKAIANSVIVAQHPLFQYAMRFPTVQITLLLAGIASADWTKQLTEGDGSRLLKRASCRGQSCATCFGPGNIICAGNSCFNPSAGEQCCSDGSYCIGATTACCGSLVSVDFPSLQIASC